jgi:hypothetical protein
MKKLIINCLATTGLTLIILAMIASLYQAKFLCVSSVYQSFLVNIIIHLGLILVQKFESKYFIIEFIVEIGFILGLLVTFGFLFKWYSSTPLWVVILMGIVIYLLGCLVNIMKINDDISYINKQLKLTKARKNKQ